MDFRLGEEKFVDGHTDANPDRLLLRLAAPPEIREWEPRRALDGSVGGLRCIRRLFRQAPQKLVRHGALFAEIGDRQGAAARSLAAEAFPEAEVEVRPDLAGRDRVICVYS